MQLLKENQNERSVLLMSTLRKDYEHNVQDRVEGSEKPKVLQVLHPCRNYACNPDGVCTWLNIGDPKIGLGFWSVWIIMIMN